MKRPTESPRIRQKAKPNSWSVAPFPASPSTSLALQLAVLLVALLGATLANAQQHHDVLTSRYDDNRTGAALTEMLLTPAAIDARIDGDQFGKLFTYDLKYQGTPGGDVYAQPLYVSNVGIAGRGTNNLLLVAAMNGFVFALDADGPKAGSDGIFWQRNLGPPPSIDDIWRNCSFWRPCLDGGANIRGSVGIMGTPVIDRQRGIVFLVARILFDPDHVIYRLHALDLRTGGDLDASPIDIVGEAQGIQFNPNFQNQRPGLALARGQIIVAFGSYADLLPYYGWVFSYRYDAGLGFTQSASFVTTPDGDTSSTCALSLPGRDPANNCAHGGIWMGGRAPAVDSDGRVLLMVGNGRNDMSATSTRNFGNSLLALDPVSLAVIDFFTPENHLAINAMDLDFGGSGPMIIPGSNLVVGGGKQGKMYVWHLNDFGKFALGDPSLVQKFDSGIVQEHVDTGNDMPNGAVIGGIVISQHAGHIMGGPAYWPRPASSGGARLFEWNENSELRAYAVDPSAAQPVTTPPVAASQDIQLGHPGGILSLSAYGARTGTGIVWAATYATQDPCDVSLLKNHAGALNAVCHGILRAYDADDLSPLWTSDLNPTRDGLGDFAKFNPPTIANGRVYMATFSNQLAVYGLLHHNYVRPAAQIIAVSIKPLLDDVD